MPMMSAIYRKLVSLGELTRELSSYEFSDGIFRPAIFSREIPEDCLRPAVLITLLDTERQGDRGTDAGTHQIGVLVCCTRLLSPRKVRELGLTVWRALERRTSLDFDSEAREAGLLYTVASPPKDETDPDGFPASYVQVTVYSNERKIP